MRNPDLILTSDEIAIVNNLIWDKPPREVAAKIGRSLVALHYYIKHRNNYPPPAKALGSFLSKEKDKQSSPPPTVKIPTRAVPTKQPKTEPELESYQRKDRLSFATKHITWNESQWRRVVFHDERKFNLDGPDGFTHYYHDMRNYERTLSQRPRGGSVFIWFAISFGGPIRCEVSTTKFKPEAYVEILQSERANITAKLDGNPDFLLQDHYHAFRDYAAILNSIDLKGIESFNFPSRTHDIDIVENIWSWLIREVFDGGRRYSRRDDLVLAIQVAWGQLPLHFIQNLYSTMPDRITELYYANGNYTNC